MSRTLLMLIALMLIFASGAYAQNCADVNGDGHVDVSDMAYMMSEHFGGSAIPTGKGDIDYRQGYNAGDMRFLIDYIFGSGPTPGCPPFPSYSLVHTNDSLILPSFVVPAGSGQFALPIYLVNHAKVSDMVLPMHVNGLGSTVLFDSLQFANSLMSYDSSTYGPVAWCRKSLSGSTRVMAFSIYYRQNDMVSGTNLLALAFFHYTSSPGGTVSMDTVTVGPHTFLNYVYGSSNAVGIPKVVVAAAVSTFPKMTVQPDTLILETLAGYPNPTPKQISILSDGGEFNWTLTKTSWINVSASAGVSGQTIDVTPNISGMAVGVYYGDIIVSSTGALNSPQKIVVKLILFPQMTVQPDTLIFETLVGYPNPNPQQFSIQSSGEPFNWTLTPPTWVNVGATSGISGQSVSVTPNIAGLSEGVFYGDIVVFSTGALGSPQKVVVKLTLKQFPSFDANCDGVFNLADIVAQINYMFRGGSVCNPCTGEWPKGK